MNKEVKIVLDTFANWLKTNNIGKNSVKRMSIAQDLFWPAYKANLNITEIENIETTTKAHAFEFKEGNLGEQLNNYFNKNLDADANTKNKIVSFLGQVSQMTPCGLNTSPNACCGKFELLYRLMRPQSSQPKKGDIQDSGLLYEIKGSDVRISDSGLKGIDYIKKSNKIFSEPFYNLGEKCCFIGNTTTTKKWKHQRVFEIEKKSHKSHYIKQFARYPLQAREKMENYLLETGFAKDSEEAIKMAQYIFKDGVESYNENLQKILLTKMFDKYKLAQGFHRLVIFGDGTNVKFLETSDDLKKVNIYADYFRIGQDAAVGLYIK